MPKYDTEDIVDIKNRKKRRKRLLKFLIFLLLVGIGAGLYFTKDMWYNKLRGIGEQYRTIVNSGQLADGNFPIEISSGAEYQLRTSGKNIIVLSDTYTMYYDTEGNLLRKRQHNYTNSILCVAGGRALIYESSGNELSVEDSESDIYSKEFDNNILCARLSKEGYTGVVTTSDNYSSEIFVYDKKGTLVYSRKCMERVTDLSFTSESKGCVITYVEAEGGKLVTSVQCLDFSQNGELWTSPGLNTVGLEVSGFDGGAFVLGFEACGYVDSSGLISSYYPYDGDMKGGSSRGGQSAVIINNDDRRKYIAALFNDGSSEPLIIDLQEPAVDVAVSGGLAYVLTQGHMMAYDFTGGLRSIAEVSDSYTGFVQNGGHVFLKGYNKIDRIDYES
ncbi:MAG: hypothetical protein KBA55_02610 [Ruminococcus sp.]|nr:hypothetical protein [Ruminococcus sp.]